MEDKQEFFINFVFIFLFMIIITGFYFMFFNKQDIGMNEKLEQYIENKAIDYNNFLEKPTQNVNVKRSEKIVVIDKFNNIFCEYYSDKENCYDLNDYNYYYNNENFLNYEDYIILNKDNITFIINDHLNQTPKVIIQ